VRTEKVLFDAPSRDLTPRRLAKLGRKTAHSSLASCLGRKEMRTTMEKTDGFSSAMEEEDG
jgi:hypothetical protein